MTETEADLLTTSEAAHLSTILGRRLTPQSIRDAADRGQLACQKTETGVRIFKRDDVSAYALAPRPRRRKATR